MAPGILKPSDGCLQEKVGLSHPSDQQGKSETQVLTLTSGLEIHLGRICCNLTIISKIHGKNTGLACQKDQKLE